jgi:hypothetical protein
MTMSALIVVQLAEAVMGLTASERFQAVRNLDSGGNFMTSRWFTITMVIVLAGSVVTLAIVGWNKRRAAQREAEQNASSQRSVRKPAEPAAPAGQSKPLTAVQAKPQAKSPGARPKELSIRGNAYIALYSFSRKSEPLAEGAKAGRSLPQFLPAKVLNATGKVVSVETTLPANVGDRVLIVMESQSVGEGTVDIIEDMGFVRQSAQPAETSDAPNARRLSVEIAGLSEAQAAQLANVVPALKGAEAARGDTSKPTETKEQAT